MVIASMFAYGQVAEHHFELESGKVVWRQVYDQPVAGLMASLKTNPHVQFLDSSFVDLKDFVFEPNGYSCSGRAQVEVKENRYRITLRNISYKPGATGNAMATAMLGGNPDFVFHADEDFVKRGALRNTTKVMRLMDVALLELFTAKEATASDW